MAWLIGEQMICEWHYNVRGIAADGVERFKA
jgi:hypothetical protein